jgi:hypothetical protein
VLHHLLFFSFAIMHLSFFPVFVVGEAIHMCGMNECYMLDAAGFLFFWAFTLKFWREFLDE